MTHPTALCAVLSCFLLQKYINGEIVFRENGVAGFIALGYLCHKIFLIFLSEILVRKIALKINENARNSAKFEQEKLQIKKIEKLCFDTYTQRQKALRIFSGKYFVNDYPP